MEKKPTLSIGMIVKNEIRCLEKCLKALQPLRDAIPCELVIADTGSTDGTREVAEKYADILFDFAWVNDFSAARNAVIERCSGKWFMTVDADEYLVSEKELVEFLTGKQADIADYCTYIVRNYSSADMKGVYTDFPAYRMGRLHPGLRYHGTIHESFTITAQHKIINLSKTIFDHDGYANVTPDQMKKKAERNLELLEQRLKEQPSRLMTYLQCVESARPQKQYWEKYSNLAMRVVMEHREYPYWGFIAPAIAARAVSSACKYSAGVAEEWALWARRTFPQSFYVKIDANYSYILFLEEYGRYDEIIPVGKEYLEGVAEYREKGFLHPDMIVSSIMEAHPLRVSAIQLILAKAYEKTGKKRQAIAALEAIELHDCHPSILLGWLERLEPLADDNDAHKLLVARTVPVYEQRDGTDDDKARWAVLKGRLWEAFSIEKSTEAWRLYKQFPGAIGSCVRLLGEENTARAQKILNEIEDWENLMPLAALRAMELGLEFPDGFYHMSPEQLHRLEEMLAQHGVAEYTLDYTGAERVTDWHRLCFAYDLLCACCMREKNVCDELADRLTEISALFLQTCYHPELIADEDAIDRLPALHRFSWQLVRAVERRVEGDWTGYVAGLRKALNEAEALKPLVQYLLSRVAQQQKQERIASASPELLALAEQVRTILAAYPADDPAVMQLKKMPAYQQVAFLLE